MKLKTKLYLVTTALHSFLLAISLMFQDKLGLWLIAVELILALSLGVFIWLIRKGLQPLEYIDIFSKLLKEEDFTHRFSTLNQPDLDRLIEQFNIMLDRLHQERLRAGERKHVFEKLMTESPIGVVLLDYDNSISECNSAAKNLLKSARPEKTDKEIAIAPFSFHQLNNVFELDKIAINQQQLVSTSQGQRLKIGHYQFRDRGFERSFFLIQEITGDILKSQKEAYEKLIRLMSHEVNNTIAITNSLLESCLNYKDELSQSSQEDFNKAINVVINRSANLNLFMQGYSEIVKLPKPRKIQFDLSQLIDNLSILFFSECSIHKIDLQKMSEDKLLVTADPHQIEQVLVNIIKNAIEAINIDKNNANRREIKLCLKQAHKGVELVIVDSGCGISEEIKSQLFKPFFTTKDSGQGIGLMLIDEILTLHGFSYKLANNSNNLGAYFKINFR